mmetsp:Transcript_13116/g.17157  ORF Transcript_13116/g.17157 Transcript_13116/m.17157 type:complete len:334 (+) Transcript_13116:107-1108(+)
MVSYFRISYDGCRQLTLLCLIFLLSKDFSFAEEKDGKQENEKKLTEQIYLNGGEYFMGSSYVGGPENETPPDGAKKMKKVNVKPFLIDKYAVSNSQFQEFVEDIQATTGKPFETDGDKYGWSFVLDKFMSKEELEFADSDEGMGRIQGAEHWVGVLGANWKHPEGQDSDNKDRGEFPVIHVSYNDAKEYCKWAGRRLPKEKEWEYAARAGIDGMPFPWGLEATPNDMNYWQGAFPKENTEEDGYAGTAPVDAYAPNTFGLYNMVGNTWEWVGGGKDEARILRGGSFVDSIDGSFNHPAMTSSRQVNTADSGSYNTGFRCASTVESTEEKKEEL